MASGAGEDVFSKRLNRAYRAVDSIQRGLGNPDLDADDLAAIVKLLEKADDRAWK